MTPTDRPLSRAERFRLAHWVATMTLQLALILVSIYGLVLLAWLYS